MIIITSCIAIMILGGCNDDSSANGKTSSSNQNGPPKKLNVPGQFPPVGPLESGFHPIRIHFEYLGVIPDSEQARFMKDVTVPHVQRLVSRFVQVRDHKDKLVINRGGHCDYPGIPDTLFTEGLSDVDLVAFVEISTDCASHTMMSTQICQFDAIDRPNAGRIKICDSWLSGEWKNDTPKRESSIVETFLHEFVHLLGFHSAAVPRFRKPGGGSVDPTSLEKHYTCELDEVTQKPKVNWDVDLKSLSPGQKSYSHIFLPGIIDAIDARGLKASECGCPVDPTKTYKNEDIEKCIRHPNHCAIAIVTEKVVEKTREYYGCSSAKGMEIENGMRPRSCRLWFTSSHWKTRVAFGEIMNYQAMIRFNYVTPMTLALLEDSGWYKVDYSVFAPPLPGLTWGHLKGCAFLLNKCVESRSKVVDPDAFCTLQNSKEKKCSKDALTILGCSGVKEVEKTALLTELPQYKYRTHGGRYFNTPAHFDHCPVFRDATMYSCLDRRAKLPGVASSHSRCYMNKSGTPSCLPTKCSSDGKSYRVITESAEIISCHEAGAEINGVVCQDPKIICANLNSFHLLPGTILLPNAGI